jgi:hypothetical protein
MRCARPRPMLGVWQRAVKERLHACFVRPHGGSYGSAPRVPVQTAGLVAEAAGWVLLGQAWPRGGGA